jgi:uncharacterized protein (DUF1810 family)
MEKRLERFVTAQKSYYQTALHEIQNGQKRSHWMWFVFPQIAGLGYSEMAQYYAIQDLEIFENVAYIMASHVDVV